MVLIDGHLNRWREALMWEGKEMKLRNKCEAARRRGPGRITREERHLTETEKLKPAGK